MEEPKKKPKRRRSRPRSKFSRVRSRAWRLMKLYGLTLAQYDEMLRKQEGVCAICGGFESALDSEGRHRRLSVDHCHSTSTVRGLLCSACNRALGGFRDKPELLVRAATYLLENPRNVKARRSR